MGVVRAGTVRRWSAVLAGVAALIAAPSVVAALPTGGAAAAPRAVLAAAARSADVAHKGYAETRGGLGLPDLPRLGRTASLLGSTTHARVWWASPRHWRVDTVTPTGQVGVYRTATGLQTWDYERQSSLTLRGEPPVRLPRTDDLLPPQAGRRLVAGVSPQDAVRAIGSRRIARHTADGVRITPADARSTIGSLDIWVERRSGLPLALSLTARGSREPAVTSRFLDLRLTRPGARVLNPALAGGLRNQTSPVLSSVLDLYAPVELPARLVGLPKTTAVLNLAGAATYGEGLTRFVVLPLPRRLGRDTVEAALRGGGVDIEVDPLEGRVVQVGTSLVNVVVAVSPGRTFDGRFAFLVVGAVTPPALQAAALELLRSPGLR